MDRRIARRAGLLLCLVTALAALSGCTYFKHRVDDLTDVMDLGFTVTKTPQFSAYINCPTVLPLGWGKVDGTFWGVADGKLGKLRHKREEKGWILGGTETLSFQNFDEKETEKLTVEDVGLLGLTLRNKTAKKRPMCIHHLHLGWLGVIWNVRYQEIGDLVLGVAGLDYRQDDGPNGGWWFKDKAPPEATSVIAEADTTEAPAGQKTAVLAKADTSSLDQAREAVAAVRERAAPPETDSGPSPLSPAPSDFFAVADTAEPAAETVAQPDPLAEARAALEEAAKPVVVGVTTTPKTAPVAGVPAVDGGALYVVKPGDTLAAIAKRQYGDVRRWKEIYRANAKTLSSPNLIRPGMKLTLPDAPDATVAGVTTAPTSSVYTVRPGDTFYAVSRKMYGDSTRWKLLYEANRGRLGLTAPSQLRPAMRLKVPAAR